MKLTLTVTLIVGILVILCGCGGPKTYTSPQFEGYKQTHKTIAILPFSVTIDPHKLPKDFTREMAEESEKEEGFNLQRELYFRFLQKVEKGEYTIQFQDVDRTNSILAKDSVTYSQLRDMDKAELCKRLNVDAVVSGKVFREKPMSTGLAVGLGVLFGVWGNTNKVNATLNIHESHGDLVWSYDHEASGSVGSSAEKLAENLMKSVSKKFPYRVQKS